jgi:hypothetical protein
MWLYAYEATLKGWTGESNAFLVGDAHFGPLYTNRVSFCNTKRNLKKLRAQARIERIAAAKARVAYHKDLEEVMENVVEDEMSDWIFGDDHLATPYD